MFFQGFGLLARTGERWRLRFAKGSREGKMVRETRGGAGVFVPRCGTDKTRVVGNGPDLFLWPF